MVKEMLLIIWQTVVAFFGSIFTISKNLFSQIPFSIYDFFTTIMEDEFTLTSIKWLDNSLLIIAGIIPLIIMFIITKFFIKLDAKISAFISFLVYAFTLFLFGSKLFWFLLLSIFVIVISSAIYLLIKIKSFLKCMVKRIKRLKKLLVQNQTISHLINKLP